MHRVSSVQLVVGRWRREEALTSAFKARGLWYLVSPVVPLLWARPPPWLWLWDSTPRSCPRRHSSSSLWPDCEWCWVGKGRESGEVRTCGIRGNGRQVRDTEWVGSDICIWVDVWGGLWRKQTGDNKQCERTRKESEGNKKQKMGEEYKQKGGKSTKRLHSTEMTKQTKVWRKVQRERPT